MTADDTTKRAAIAMLAKGAATLSEVARLADTSRQLVRHWAKQAGLDVAKIRERRIAREWRNLLKKPHAISD